MRWYGVIFVIASVVRVLGSAKKISIKEVPYYDKIKKYRIINAGYYALEMKVEVVLLVIVFVFALIFKNVEPVTFSMLCLLLNASATTHLKRKAISSDYIETSA
ncbi:hypothetical protein [Clostridium sp.]|uniref:hypothetical protein n=1 Tax=Clostridium sp. TaxID=1506 RepID=UPI003F3BC923